MFELEVPSDSYPKLKHYCQALWEINEEMNLTRHTSYEKFVTRDLLDTIELSKLIPQGKEVLDIGSGGGVPGMVLAIIRPDLKVSLTDSVGKKASALGAIAEAVEVVAGVLLRARLVVFAGGIWRPIAGPEVGDRRHTKRPS